MSDMDTKTVAEWPVPKCSKDVERFLGFANYHRTFVPKFAEVAQLLYGLTGRNKFHWGKEQQQAFEALKKALTEPPVLALPNGTDPFILDTDASDTAIGAVLSQVQGGEEKVIAFSSFALTAEQKRYCTTRKELLSIVRFTRHFKYYLLGRLFTVRTDHASLTWLLRFKDPQGQLARWMEELSQYHMVVKHRPGAKHGNADALSRIPDTLVPCPSYVAAIEPEKLPCGGCLYCKRADQQWGEFTRDVDEAIGLTDRGWGKSNRFNGQGAGKIQSAQEGCSVTPPVLVAKVLADPPVGVGFDKDSEAVLETASSWDWEGHIENSGFDIQKSGKQLHIRSCEVGFCQDSAVESLSCWGFSYRELKEEQERDSDLELILGHLKGRPEPEEGALFLASSSAKYYWVNRDLFLLRDGVLFKHRTDSEDLELVVPKNLQEKAIQWHHDIPSAAHQGVARTKAKLKEKFFWVHLARDVNAYVLSCDVCSRNKKNKRYGKVPLTEYHAGAPMERVHIDFIGPLPKTPNGNEHCLMMVDQFTKWVECVPLPSQKAEVTAKAAIDALFSRFGCPLQLFSDQGRNFDGKLFEALCQAFQIHKARTTPYRPSSNGQVERYNRTLLDAVRCFLGKKQNHWDEHVQQITGAIRASVCRSTGYTPNMMMLGREVNTPAHLMFPVPGQKFASSDEYVTHLVENLQQAHTTARETLKTSQKNMKRNYDLKVLLRPYSEGDLVYILDTAVVKGKCRKLSPPWKGPGVIVKKLSAYLYRVKLRNSVLVINHDRMAPCRDRKIPAWISKERGQGSVDQTGLTDEDDKLHCVCQKPWEGRFMIQCDYCDVWYHGSCVNVSTTDALDIDEYKCSACRRPGGKLSC